MWSICHQDNFHTTHHGQTKRIKMMSDSCKLHTFVYLLIFLISFISQRRTRRTLKRNVSWWNQVVTRLLANLLLLEAPFPWQRGDTVQDLSHVVDAHAVTVTATRALIDRVLINCDLKFISWITRTDFFIWRRPDRVHTFRLLDDSFSIFLTSSSWGTLPTGSGPPPVSSRLPVFEK